jgi:hypothetical protein
MSLLLLVLELHQLVLDFAQLVEHLLAELEELLEANAVTRVDL